MEFIKRIFDVITSSFKRILGVIVLSTIVITGVYFLGVYYLTYSEGTRAGELIKFSKKGVIVKTWEGEISQGVSGAKIFTFSVEDGKKDVIKSLQEHQGKYVKVHYFERYGTFFWLGDTKYFITKVEQENSPHSHPISYPKKNENQNTSDVSENQKDTN